MAQNGINKCVIIGGSAGALQVILKCLPELDTDHPIIVVLHRKEQPDATLEQLFAAHTSKKVKEVEDKDSMYPAHIYIAPPNYHLLIEQNNTLSLDTSEKINYSRPSIDATFQTGADAFGKNVLGILLSGANEDGVNGLKWIKSKGGQVAIQDPLSAQVSTMPLAAIKAVAADFLFSDTQLAKLINSF